MKHFFPANNTSVGFVNYFDGITPPWERVNRIYILKGGPGVGKNTFMHKLEEKARRKGYNVEYYHCASDCDSLDALKVTEPGIIMIDGTAPHIIDPVIPGAVDNILNLGVYLNEKQLERQVGEIKAHNKQNSVCYKKAFAYLRAAGSLEENTDFLYSQALDKSALCGIVRSSLEETKDLKGYGHVRKLFASAYTPQGYVNHLQTLVGKNRLLCLKGPSIAAAEFIRLVIQHCVLKGLNCEVFYSSLLADKPEHIIIPDLELCITSDTDIIKKEGTVIELDNIINKNLVDEDDVIFNKRETEKLVSAAVDSLKQAKAIHDKIETIYKDSMDFERSTSYIDSFLSELF